MPDPRALVAAAIGGLSMFTNCVAQPAGDSTAKGVVLGTGASRALSRTWTSSLAFYRDAFGMEIPALPESGARPYNPSNAQLFAMFDIPGAKERHQFARLGEVRFEIMEIQNVAHSTLPLRVQDPGTVTLVFVARDVGATLERAKKAGAMVITAGGAPVKLADGSRSVLVRDIDGRFIELRQAATAAAPDAPELTGMRLSIAVAESMARTLDVYRSVLGFTVEEDRKLGADAQLRTLTGLSTAEFRRAITRGPGTSLPIEFVEYGGVDRTTHGMRIQDRGRCAHAGSRRRRGSARRRK